VKIIFKVIVFSLLILTVGCTIQNSFKKPQPEQQVNQDEKQVYTNLELAEKAKKTAETVKGVEESTAVVINRDISIAIKVSGFDRLRLKLIREEVHNRIKELHKDYNIHVTTDKKLFMQVQQIERQLVESRGESLIDIQNEVNKINKSM